jgi:hypothetical protein
MKKRVLIGQEDPNKPFGDMEWRVEGPEDEGMTKVWIGKVGCGNFAASGVVVNLVLRFRLCFVPTSAFSRT